MATLIDERNRILRMVEAGEVTADEAGQLLDALASAGPELERERPFERSRSRSRTLRIRVSSLNPKQQKMQMTATVAVSLIRISLRLGARLIPQLSNSALEDLLRSIESGASGRLLDLQDLEEGQRVEIFAE
jgi:polyhydroxyalkanoate synthesis regulator phasin